MASNGDKGVVPALLCALDGPGPLVILPHDNPDPDALASAAAIKYLAKVLLGKDATIAQGGIVGRAENRAMVKYLNIDLAPVSGVPFDRDTLVVLVDTQPGRPNNSLPEGICPQAVIDHHPPYENYNGVRFLDLREDYGATSTIVTEYLRDSRVEIESKIATALFYGIAAETQDLGRESTPADIAASQFLYPYTNKRRLAKIENARVPRIYFKAFRDAIEKAQIYGPVVISVIGEVQYPDMVAEVADFLLRLEDVQWSCALGCYDRQLYVSLRTSDRDANAGEVLRKTVGAKSAGGHDTMAGGRVTVGEEGLAFEKAAVRVKDRLLKTLGVEETTGATLVG